MPATILVTDPEWSWREWLKSNLADRDYVCLDVSNADYGPPSRVFFAKKGKVRSYKFVGSIYANRNPVDLLLGARQLIDQAQDPVIALFEMRESPVLRQMALSLVETIDADEIYAPEGSSFLHEPWPIPASSVSLTAALPQAAQLAQRRARWLEMIENCTEHKLELDHVALHGVRLGSGRRLHGSPFDDLGIHVEVYGQSLLIVGDHEPDEQALGDAMNLTHATKLHLVSPAAYDWLVCSVARGHNEDFGMGVVQGIDFEKREMTLLNTAVAPAPIRAVRIGSTRIDDTGKETGETKPWAV